MAFDKIIVLDDEMIIRKSLEQQLRKKRYSVASASTLKEAQALLGKDKFDLMFVDVRLPDGEGTEILDMFQRNPDAPMVIMITGFGSIDNAVECMRLGAFGYITKPFDQKQIEMEIKRAEDYARALKVNRYYSDERKGSGEMLGQSLAMQQLKRVIRRVAATDASVLIRGENGTGKELVAQELYRLSPRADMPFIKVNCAAVTDSLMESEFFGHEKGSFTGATERREGRFELADKGTILLDEISEIPSKLQAKLLRALQEQEFERVGGNKTIKVDVRVISSTNRHLEEAIQKGEFREDLFYRLNVFPIMVPPLRERKEDIMLLANDFLRVASRSNGMKLKGFSDEAVRALESHVWPGNVRELKNCIERAVILSEEDQPVQSFALGLNAHPLMLSPAPAKPPAEVASSTAYDQPAVSELSENAPAETQSSPQSLEDIEREHILKTLHHHSGNRTETAKALQVSIRTLRNKLNQYKEQGIEIE